MRSSRTSKRWTVMAALFVLISQTWGISSTVSAAVGQEILLPPTPLVLKDGRIANVSIHLLPFGRGEGELAGDAVAGLARLTAQVATDCFLTAQVIGHVSSREVADNETLAAHRLARSRADAVQSSLIGGGLPAKSIASVWDWQFLVREPRATLWVFRLIEGEDCEGLPLEGGAPQLVAENALPQPAQPLAAEAPVSVVPTPVAKSAAVDEPDVEAAQIQPATDAAPKVVDAEAPAPVEQAAPAPALPAMVGSAVAAEATPERSAAPGSSDALDALVTAVVDAEAQLGDDASVQTEAQAGTQAPQPGVAPAAQPAARSDESGSPVALEARQDQSQQVAVPAGPVVGAVPTVTRPIPALSPSQAAAVASSDAAAATTVAAIEPVPAPATGGSQPARTAAAGPQLSAKQQDPDREGKVEWGQDGNVVITFATNSSYFPPGTTRRLSTMLEGMTSAGRYRVQLQVGVSATDKVVGATTPQEAKRYNQWLAERRMARVQEWLTENAQDRQLEIEPVFQADDSSRRVVVRVAPVG